MVLLLFSLFSATRVVIVIIAFDSVSKLLRNAPIAIAFALVSISNVVNRVELLKRGVRVEPATVTAILPPVRFGVLRMSATRFNQIFSSDFVGSVLSINFVPY